MTAWASLVAAVVCVVGVWIGVTAPETTPVDPTSGQNAGDERDGR